MWEVHYEDFEAPWEPEGYIFLAWAFGEIMDVVQEQSLRAWGAAEPVIDWRAHLPLLDRQRQDLDPEAAIARDHVADWADKAAHLIGRAAYAKRFEARCRHIGGGDLLDVPNGWWGINDFWPRFARCALNTERPHDVEAEATHWIFIEERSFCWFADELRIEYGLQPVWQRRNRLDVSPSDWPGPGPDEVDRNLVRAGGDPAGSLLPEKAKPKPTTSRSRGRGRRPGVGGWAAADAPIIKDMVPLVRGGMSPWAAAQSMVDRIEGYTRDEASKIKRVVARFKESYDEWGSELG